MSGDPTTINITVANHNGDLSWQWFNGYATTNDITPASGNNESSINAVINAGVNSGGIYRIVVTDNTTGCQVEELVTVVVPNIQMPGTASLCPGESCVEIGPNVIDQGINYEWSGPNGFSSSDPLICVSELGIYTLTAGNCPSTSSSVEVINQAHDPLLLPLENYELCQGNSSVIGLQGPEPAGYTYQWSPTFNLSSNQVTQYNPTYIPNSIPDPNPLNYTFSAIRDSVGKPSRFGFSK